MHMMEQYKGAPFGELSPHVFAVADASYRAMMSEGCSQSILVSGESGAGKTETTKLIMQYLTYVGGRAAGDDRTVEQQVLESAYAVRQMIWFLNHLLDLCILNFLSIQFDSNGRISGAAIRTYLLERSRVVQITDPERNYHCFYQLCASGTDLSECVLSCCGLMHLEWCAKRFHRCRNVQARSPSNFHYLNQSKIYELEGVSNAEEYVKTRRAMGIVGISDNEQEAIFRTLAGILHLGNVEFSPGREHDSSVIKDQKSNFHLQMAANLFRCDVNLLLFTLTTRSIQTYEGIIVKALDCNAAVAGRDALAKTVYARLFDWLVEKINRSVGQDRNSKIQIGVLDIYGFECFKLNSFEQFCINFANEKLQQHFNEHVFKMEQEEYQREEINWSYIEFIDNQDVLDLIEKKPIGIIALLDEACMFPKSTHETFSNKLFQNFRAHPRLEKAKFSETDFTISHYAGKVNYQTETFLDKNRDYVVVEHCNLLASSRCRFISGLFPPLPEESSRSSYKFSSVASRFKQQLQALMETLSSTEPHYIRCVKPNSLNRPQRFENQSILHQLRCGGVLEAVRISLAGYPTRKTYHEFVDRFGIIALDIMDGSYDDKTMTEKILQRLKLGNFQVSIPLLQLGKTKVFLRAGQIAILDSRRAEVLDSAAKCIQGRLRTYLARREYVTMRIAAISLQACCRALSWNKADKMTFMLLVIINKLGTVAEKYTFSSNYKELINKKGFFDKTPLELLNAAMRFCWVFPRGILLEINSQRCVRPLQPLSFRNIFEAHWRMFKIRSIYRNRQSKIIAIQCLWRQKLAKRELRRLKKEANEAGALRLAKSKLEKQLEDLTWRLHLEKKIRVSNEEAKLVEMSKLQKTVESLTLELEAAKLATLNEFNKNMVLERQLELSAKEKSALERDVVSLTELRNENALLKSSLNALAEKNSMLESELAQSKEDASSTIAKLQQVEKSCLQLQMSLRSMEEKLSNLEAENHILRQKTLNVSPRSNRAGFVKPLLDKFSGALVLSSADQKSYESPTPSKFIAPLSQGFSDTRRTKSGIERHQGNLEILSRCIKENLGFKDGKPVAACVIYKCLLHWHAFESERTAIFDFIIESINNVLKEGDEDATLPYWLSNASALLCLLQRNLRSNGFVTAGSQHSAGSAGLNGRLVQFYGYKCEVNLNGKPGGVFDLKSSMGDVWHHDVLVEVLWSHKGAVISENCPAPRNQRVHGGKPSRSPAGVSQQSPSSEWDSILKFLDSLMSRLRGNHVSILVLFLHFYSEADYAGFAFINIQLFNSLLLRRECCSFSNGEYVKSGLAELEKWIVNATEEFAGTSWHELNYIRQAVGFLVIHQKRTKSLEEIRQDLCPVVSQMREIVNKDSQNLSSSNSFLLDDDLSIPFSTEDVYMAIPALNPSDVELPQFFLNTLLHSYCCRIRSECSAIHF
ncbi:Myosin-15 [Sesamum angolense]|uniref:Myosin-15 n=1 Tax=Sesamum angolense TaxID=2727404 RepID=A0AAE1WQH5_9LAMI|nr:Myosin-15 [Sesamum angolense]